MQKSLGFYLLIVLSMVCAQAVQVQGGWVRLPPPTLQETTAYFTLQNPSDKTLRLIGASSPVASQVQLMKTAFHQHHQGNVTHQIQGMEQTQAFEIPAHKRLELKPGGNHLMLMGLKRPLVEGENISLKLIFQGSQTLQIKLVVHNR